MPTFQQAYNPSAYRFTADLISGPDSDRVYQPEPGEVAREELALRKLGARGWGRLYHFKHFYGPGWGEGRGCPLSPRATEAFYHFLAEVEFPASVTPSIFLTDEGGLELSWEDTNGHSIQVAFLPTGIEIFRAADEVEIFRPLSQTLEVSHLVTVA